MTDRSLLWVVRETYNGYLNDIGAMTVTPEISTSSEVPREPSKPQDITSNEALFTTTVE